MIFQLGKKSGSSQGAAQTSLGGASFGKGENSEFGTGLGGSVRDAEVHGHPQGRGDPAFLQAGSGSTPGSSSAAETVKRWREAAAKARSQASNIFEESLLEQNLLEEGMAEVGSGLGQDSASRGASIESAKVTENATLLPQATEGGQLAVEWPDPRAAITLNKPILPGTPLVQPAAQQVQPAKLARSFPFFRSASGNSTPSTPAVTNSNMTNSGPSQTPVLGNAFAGSQVNAATQPLIPSEPGQAALVGDAVNAVTGGRSPVWKEQRPGAPGDVMSAIKGRNQLPPEEEIRARFGTNIKSALGPGTIIEGKFRFDSPVSIEGTLIGEVTSNSVLIVGSQANVTAKISVGSLIILGRVHGDVDCEELLEIKAGGQLEGDVRSKRIAIDDGGWFRGLCTPTISQPEPKD